MVKQKSEYQTFTNYRAHLKKLVSESLGVLLGISMFAVILSVAPVIVLFIFSGLGSLIFIPLFLVFGLAFWLLIYGIPIIILTVKFLRKQLPPPPLNKNKALTLLKKKLSDTLRETIRITQNPNKEVSIFSSKIGGIAYWPKSIEKSYPYSDRGNPLRMLAQINLVNLPDNKFLPKTGLLQFFVEDVDYNFGLLFDSKVKKSDLVKGLRHRVIYHKNIIHNLNDLITIEPTPNPTQPFPVHKEVALDFSKEQEYMSFMDYRFPKGSRIDELIDTYSINTGEELLFHSDFSKLFGYPSFTQWDPRATYFKNESEPYELLFQLHSEGDVMWGDSGVANFFIKPSALKLLDFSEVLYYWDCS